ncbi:transposase, MuDR, MULE transposase domain protein [Tanacetum coccineum]
MCTLRPCNSPQSEVTGSSKKPFDYVLSSLTLDHMLETPLDVNNAFMHAWQSNTFDHMTPTPDAPVYQIDPVSSIDRFGVAIRAFLTSMRPLIIIDGAHLKGTYEGTNLLAVGMDGNNQIVPIATGVCQGGESTEAWSFFLSKLKESIGVVQDMTVISDRHPGIVSACATVFPNAFHGYCCRHLMMNCEIRNKKHRAIYWKTCKAYTTGHFARLFTVLQGFKPIGFPKLLAAGLGTWSRAYCPADRYNYMTSNSAECINSLTKDIRKLPITRLVDRQRETLQNWFTNRREKYKDAAADELTEWAAAKVHRRKLKSAKWIVDEVDKRQVYQVNDLRNVEIVDLDSHECTFRETYKELVYPLQGPL